MTVDADLAADLALMRSSTHQWLRDAARRVESELSRLREQRDEWKDTAEEIGGELRRSSELREAAEARCARLQQALAAFDPFVSWIEANHPKVLREMPREEFGAIALGREALAGLPDTPADSQEGKT